VTSIWRSFEMDSFLFLWQGEEEGFSFSPEQVVLGNEGVDFDFVPENKTL